MYGLLIRNIESNQKHCWYSVALLELRNYIMHSVSMSVKICLFISIYIFRFYTELAGSSAFAGEIRLNEIISFSSSCGLSVRFQHHILLIPLKIKKNRFTELVF